MKSSNQFAEFLNKDLTEITDEELMQIVDGELTKAPNDVDADLVEHILLILEKRTNKESFEIVPPPARI